AKQWRAEDEEKIQFLRGINKPIAEATIRDERYTLSLLDEDDKAPIGVYAYLKDNQLTIYVSLASLTGTDLLTSRATGTDHKQVAKQVANELVSKGALDVIEQAKQEL